MKTRRLTLGLGPASGLVVVASVASAVAASNTVASTRASDLTVSITANDLKPPQCASLSLSAVLSIAASGTSASALVLGTPADESNSSGGGNDCVLGGVGTDTATQCEMLVSIP